MASVKVQTLEIRNVGLIERETISFDAPLLIFYGQIRAGKSTILNAVRWVLGAAWPADIIRHGAEEALVRMTFSGGSIERSWYRGKDGTTKARDIMLVIDNRPVRRPAAELAKFLNPFLLDQNHLANMSETQRKAFFASLFPTDTAELDAEAAALEEQAKELRASLKSFGDLGSFDPSTPVQPARLDVLQLERSAIIDKDNANTRAVREQIKRLEIAYAEEFSEVELHNTRQAQIDRRLDQIESEFVRLGIERDELKGEQTGIRPYPNKLDLSQLEAARDSRPDTAVIDQKIQDAGAQNVRAQQWQKDKQRYDAMQEQEKTLRGAEARQREIKAQRAAKLKDVASGVAGLEFDEAGNVVFEGTTAGMLSTSQIMRLSTLLSELYPPGFGLDLVDRGESLGKSIWDLIGYAQKEQRTVLATVVGDAPAQTPPQVGVFVVENGKVKKS